DRGGAAARGRRMHWDDNAAGRHSARHPSGNRELAYGAPSGALLHDCPVARRVWFKCDRMLAAGWSAFALWREQFLPTSSDSRGVRHPAERAASAGDRSRHRQPGGCCILYADPISDPGLGRTLGGTDAARRRFSPMTTDEVLTQRALTRATAGERLSALDALALADCTDPRPLMSVAAALRDGGHGGLVS